MTNDKIVFEWHDVDVSLNKFFAGKHWTVRNKYKDYFHMLFAKLLDKKYKQVEHYTVTLEYNSRLDPTNTIILIKIGEDFLRHINILTDDTKKYCKSVTIIPVETMGKKHYKMTFTILSYASKKNKPNRADELPGEVVRPVRKRKRN
jgi:hypothetical protein